MRNLPNFKVQHKCGECEIHSSGFFCEMPQTSVKSLESLKITNTYPRGAVIFTEGQPANGVFMLCQGKVKLSTCSRDGKVIILRIAVAGEVLGLSTAISGSCYEATAEVVDAAQVNFVRREDFLRFIEHDTDACFSALKQLSRNYHAAYTQVRSFGLSHTAGDKLAKLLLEWSAEGTNGKENGNGSVRLKVTFTHEDISEMIGTSRETVTRILKDFRDRKLITTKGSELIILDRRRLDSSIGGAR